MALFMEKALIVVVFMYAVSFSMFGGQYLFGDVLGITLTNFQGQPIKPALLTFVNQNNFTAIAVNSTSGTLTQVKTNPLVAAVSAGWELFQLFTGTYIFNLMLFFGIPQVFVYCFSGIYVIFAARAFIGYIKEFI